MRSCYPSIHIYLHNKSSTSKPIHTPLYHFYNSQIYPLPTLSLSNAHKCLYGLNNCSFLKNLKNPTQTNNWKIKAIQNQCSLNPSRNPPEKSGKTVPGPILFGALALAAIVANDPIICAAISVKEICNLVKVCNKIIPNPTP